MRTCADVQRHLSRFVDGDPPAGEQAAIASHLASCAACRGLEADLRRIRAAARTLGPVLPPDHLWAQIAGRLPAAERATRTPRLAPWLAIAALLVVVAVGVYLAASIARHAPAAAPADNAAAAHAVQDVAEELDQALTHYERAVAGLETLVREDNDSMGPVASGALRANLAAIDRAIAESRTALLDQPQSASARAALADALRQKVDVLRTTVALVNDLRRERHRGAAGAMKPGRQS
jgi:hypothetical protein